MQVAGDMVIVAYQPKRGQEAALAALVETHVPRLRDWGLATGRPALTMQAAGGALVEVFEWKPGAVQSAHSDPRVLGMWAEFAAVCTIVPLTELPEAATMFATFVPVATV